jgi:hypothetical protein
MHPPILQLSSGRSTSKPTQSLTTNIAEIIADSKNAYVQALNKGASLSAALAAADLAAAKPPETQLAVG